jgi:similar to stage IV sporulation protein
VITKDSIFGYREYRLIGDDFERFFNRVADEALTIYTIRPTEGGVTFRTWFFAEKALREITEELGLEIERTSSGGLPIFLSKYKHRYGIFAGIIITFLFLIFTSFFIFDIQIDGNYLIYDEDILRVLEENGLYKGALAHRIDPQRVKLELLEEFESISYAYVNLKGSRAEVRIIESNLPPALDSTTPCNIVAAEDGQIIRFETYRGEACVLRGEGVEEGQLLVTGVLDSKRIGYRTVHASALIMARTMQTITITQPYITTEQVLSGEEERVYTLNILGIEIALGKKNSDFDFFHEEKESASLTLWGGRTLPVSFTKTVRYGLTEVEKVFSQDEALEHLRQQIEERERIGFCGLEVESKEENVVTTEEGVTMTATYTVIKNIAKEQEIYLSSPK